MKNGNGNGSVYKASGKRRKPWIVRVTTGYSTSGTQIRKIIGSYETKREGQEALSEYLKNPTLFSKITKASSSSPFCMLNTNFSMLHIFTPPKFYSPLL